MANSYRPTMDYALFVGNLDADTTSEQILDFFPTGLKPKCVSISITSKGDKAYARVNMPTREIGAKAIEKLQGHLCNGSPVVMYWHEQGSTLRATGLGNVRISGLVSETTDRQLYDAFSTYGQISSALLIRDKDNIPTGSANLCFVDVKAAENAIAKHQNDEHIEGFNNNVPVTVTAFKRAGEYETDYKDLNHSVYIVGYPFGQEMLVAMFETVGKIEEIRMKEAREYTSNGRQVMARHPTYTVRFKEIGSVNAAIDAFNYIGFTTDQAYEVVKLQQALAPGVRAKMRQRDSCTIKQRTFYMGLLSAHVAEREIYNFFSFYAPVEAIKLLRDHDHPFRSNRNGFIVFKDFLYPQTVQGIKDASHILTNSTSLQIKFNHSDQGFVVGSYFEADSSWRRTDKDQEDYFDRNERPFVPRRRTGLKETLYPPIPTVRSIDEQQFQYARTEREMERRPTVTDDTRSATSEDRDDTISLLSGRFHNRSGRGVDTRSDSVSIRGGKAMGSVDGTWWWWR